MSVTNTYAMRQMEERHMATKVDLMVWSQKMDLLAISNAKGEVALHRLSWQKVWSFSPPSDGVVATGIAWRPDGKVIAISYSNNELLLVNVENKDIIDKRTYTSTASNKDGLITNLCWLEEHDCSNRNSYETAKNGACHYLPKLPPISRTFGSITEENGEIYEDLKKIEDQHELNLLVVGLADGRLEVSVFGLFRVGTLNLTNPESERIVAVDAAPNLSRLFVLVLSDDGIFQVYIYNTSIFSKYAAEIHALGCKYGQIMSLLDYLENTIQAITEACENMLLAEMESKLSQFANSMPSGTVSADFLELLMFGVASDSLETFLLKDLTDKGIKKLSHSMELSHSNIQKLILRHLQPVAQKIAFHLSDLRGMARLMDRFQAVGIEEEAVASTFRENGSFMIKASEVIGVTDISLKKYKVLFKWLHDVFTRLLEEGMSLPGVSEQDTAFIADYLYDLEGNLTNEANSTDPLSENKPPKKKRCYLDLLGQYIADSELTDPVPYELNPWEKFLSENQCIAEHPAIIPRFTKMSLVQQHRRFKDSVVEVFEKPKLAIGQKIHLEDAVKLTTVSTPNPRVSMRYVDSSGQLIVATIPQASSTYLTLVMLDTVGPPFTAVHKVNVYFKSMDPSIGCSTVDLQLFNDSALSVLLAEPAGGAAVFAQLQLKKIEEAVRTHSLESQMRVFEKDGEKCIDGFLLPDCKIKTLDNMRASRLAVSGGRKVAVILSENTHKVRTYEMEVEEDEEEEELETTRSSTDT